MKLTVEQQLAVDLEGVNILIAAGAGSGKTRVLVERILRQIEAGLATVDQYVILTFTNAAAAELRERIQKALESSSNPDVRRQINQLSHATIKTFHAFCADICRSYAAELDVDSSFRILVDHEAEILLRRAVEQAMEDSFAAADPQFLHLVDAFSTEKDNRVVSDMAVRLLKHSYCFVDPVDVLERTADAYVDGTSTQWKRDAVQAIQEMLEAIDLTPLREAVSSLHDQSQQPPYIEKYEKYIEAHQSYIDRLRAIARSYAPQEVHRSPLTDSPEHDTATVHPLRAAMDQLASLPSAPRLSKSEVGEEFMNELTVLREKMRKEIAAARDALELLTHADDDIALSAPLMRALVDLTRRIDAAYHRLKARRNAVDYNDLEQYAIRILRSDLIASQLRESFSYLYVDEYQDSNAIQEHILCRIARSTNRFMVGDIKQSIYKFRNADPSIFADKLARFRRVRTLEETASLEQPDVVIVLGTNFRTRSEVLDAINEVFAVNMHGEVEFDEAARLSAGASYASDHGPYVTYVGVEDDPPAAAPLAPSAASPGSGDSTSAAPALDPSSAPPLSEPEAVAALIDQHIGQPIYDARTGAYRPCSYRDIVVLHRSPRSVMKDLELAFRNHGIPLFADSGDGFFQSLEIKIVHALLSVIDNPLRDVEWLAAMRSPCFDIAPSTIARLAELKGTYYGRTKTLAEASKDPKLQSMIDIIEELQRKAQFMPLDDLIWLLYEVGDLYTQIGRWPDGAQRQANLRQLAEIATQLRSSDVVTLSSFLQIVSDIKDTGSDYGTAKTISEVDDVVRFLSIHKSKGLEFPVVILAGCARKFNESDARGDLILSRTYATAIAPVDTERRIKRPFFLSKLVAQRITEEMEQEELRLLYVAMTRAMDRLILVRSRKAGGIGYAQWLDRCLSEVIMTSPAPPDSSPAPPDSPADSPPSAQTPTSSVSSPATPEAPPAASAGASIVPATALLSDAEVERRLRYRFPAGGRSIETFRPSGSIEAPLSVPRFRLDGESLGLRIGSATHRALERYVSRTPDPALLPEIMQSCADEQGIDIRLLDDAKIHAFMESELGQRLQRAEHIYKETRFVHFTPDGKHQGIIDLFFVERGQIVLIDYKTDSAASGSVEQRAERHRQQLRIYADALERLKGLPVAETYVYFLSDGVFFAM